MQGFGKQGHPGQAGVWRLSDGTLRRKTRGNRGRKTELTEEESPKLKGKKQCELGGAQGGPRGINERSQPPTPP